MEKCFDAESVERKVMTDFQDFVKDKIDHVQGQIQELKKENEGSQLRSQKAKKKLKQRQLALEKEQENLVCIITDIHSRESTNSNFPIRCYNQIASHLEQFFSSGFQISATQLCGSVESWPLGWWIFCSSS